MNFEDDPSYGPGETRWKTAPYQRGGRRDLWEGHTVTCLCHQCYEAYKAHSFYGNHCECGFCIDHRYAMNRAEMSERNGGNPRIMSTMNMCERCETFALGKAVGLLRVRLRPDGELPEKQLEICPGCVEDLLHWIAGGSLVGERPRAYKEPYEPPPAPEEVSKDELISFILGKMGPAALGAPDTATDPTAGRHRAQNTTGKEPHE